MSRLDPAWLDAQYDNRARVPDHPADLRTLGARHRRSRGSARRAGSTSPTATTPAETLDVFPSPRDGAPVLVFIHGGWWRALDKRDHSFVAPAFTPRRRDGGGAQLRAGPSVTIETIALQMTRALAWTFRHAALYGGDPRRIVVAGHSAGGHLAAMLLRCRWPIVGADLPVQPAVGRRSRSPASSISSRCGRRRS